MSEAITVCAGKLESVVVTVKDELPLEVGVPEMIPVYASRVSPAGRPPDRMDQL